jgi:CRISPR/Cas system CSM-associated protein Csm4 (group 5 of RAMP superfamily)
MINISTLDVKRGAVADQKELDLQLTEEMLPYLLCSLRMDKDNREQYLKNIKKTEQYPEKKIEQFPEKKREQNLEKKKKGVALRIVGPKKQFDSENTKKNQEKEEDYSWYVIEFNVYSLTQLQIYININYMLMLETSYNYKYTT